jgi:hypothetical protein
VCQILISPLPGKLESWFLPFWNETDLVVSKM